MRNYQPTFQPPDLSGPPRYLRPTTRNLIYHCFPNAANGIWRECAAGIVEHWKAFNGRRIVAIAQGKGCEPAELVKSVWPKDCEFLILPNCGVLYETVSFLPLLLSIASTNPGEVAFYYHTKGTSSIGDRRAITTWREKTVEHLLGEWPKCMDALERYASAGVMKMVWPIGKPHVHPSGLARGSWMFAGTGFWFRHDMIFRCRNWRQVPVDRFGTEAWLGDLIEPEDSVSMYQPWPLRMFPPPSPYHPATYGLPEKSEK